jgi:ADP-ribose pyrophosphatase YjhB (NUDIX family)
MKEKKVNCVGCILINNKNEMLLQKRTYDYHGGIWTTFGGSIKRYEDSADAIDRELFEELGIKIYSRYYKTIRFKVKRKTILCDIYFAYINGTKQLRLDEGAGFAYFNKNEIKNLKMLKYNRDLVNEFYKEMKK